MSRVRWNREAKDFEKLCLQCGEWWPVTEEFFYKSEKGLFRSPCKACIHEHKEHSRKTKPCCVPGCNQPRAPYAHASRCLAHLQEYNASRKVVKA